MLTEGPDSILGLIPLEYNVQRLSHKFAKRIVDVSLSALALPFVAFYGSVTKDEGARQNVKRLNQVLRGELSLVGVAARKKGSQLSKAGLTSLAAITLASPAEARDEDIEQLDLYYARHHSLGMDLEILLRTLLLRRR